MRRKRSPVDARDEEKHARLTKESKDKMRAMEELRQRHELRMLGKQAEYEKE